MADFSGATESMVNLIPLAMTGGIVAGLTKSVMPQQETQSQTKYSPLTAQEVVQMIGQTRTNILKSHEGKTYKFDNDTFIYSDGEYYLLE